MKYSLYYIETTLNGYITKKCPILKNVSRGEIADLSPYDENMYFRLDGQEVDINSASGDEIDISEYSSIAGDFDELEAFLQFGKPNVGEDFDCSHNTYLEFWRTESLGYYDDKYVGLKIEADSEV